MTGAKFAGLNLTEEQVRQIIRDEMNTHRYETLIPLPRDEEIHHALLEAGIELTAAWPVDDNLLVYLTWESFARQAENEHLELVEFDDLGEVPPEEISPETVKPFMRPAADFIWRRFRGVAQRPPVSYWLEAESLHDTGQNALAVGEVIDAEGN